jgi:hypothetical protein
VGHSSCQHVLRIESLSGKGISTVSGFSPLGDTDFHAQLEGVPLPGDGTYRFVWDVTCQTGSGQGSAVYETPCTKPAGGVSAGVLIFNGRRAGASDTLSATAELFPGAISGADQEKVRALMEATQYDLSTTAPWAAIGGCGPVDPPDPGQPPPNGDVGGLEIRKGGQLFATLQRLQDGSYGFAGTPPSPPLGENLTLVGANDYGEWAYSMPPRIVVTSPNMAATFNVAPGADLDVTYASIGSGVDRAYYDIEPIGGELLRCRFDPAAGSFKIKSSQLGTTNALLAIRLFTGGIKDAKGKSLSITSKYEISQMVTRR